MGGFASEKCDVKNKNWTARTSTWTTVCVSTLYWTCGELTQQSHVIEQHIDKNTLACEDMYTQTHNMRHTQLSHAAGVVHGWLSLKKHNAHAAGLYTIHNKWRTTSVRLALMSWYVAGGSTSMLQASPLCFKHQLSVLPGKLPLTPRGRHLHSHPWRSQALVLSAASAALPPSLCR